MANMDDEPLDLSIRNLNNAQRGNRERTGDIARAADRSHTTRSAFQDAPLDLSYNPRKRALQSETTGAPTGVEQVSYKAFYTIMLNCSPRHG